MNLLLDTHVALWALTDDPRLGGAARALIADEANHVAVSVASLWEIAIKHALSREGAGRMPISAGEALSLFHTAGYDVLPITAAHVVALEALAPIHRDPFDRLLVAQALSEPLRLLTRDPLVARYSDTVIMV